MIERTGGWFPLLLVAVLAALTFWLERAVQPAVDPRGGQPSGEPDYVVDGLSAVRMDSEGKVKHTLRARKMTHYADADMTVLVEPRFVTYSEARSPVTVTSRNARMSGNGEHVYFEDDVKVVRAPFGARSELVLETEFLHVIPDDNVAKTDKPVTIRDESATVVAGGFELNSETRLLKLHGRVKSVFTGSHQ